MNRRDRRQLEHVTAQMRRNGHLPDWRTDEPHWGAQIAAEGAVSSNGTGRSSPVVTPSAAATRKPRPYIPAAVLGGAVLATMFATAGGANAEGDGNGPTCPGDTYTVEAGDTMSKLFKLTDIDPGDRWAGYRFGAINPNIPNPDRILIGQVVCLTSGATVVVPDNPPPAPAPEPAATPVAQQMSASIEAPIRVVGTIDKARNGWSIEAQQHAMQALVDAGFSIAGAAEMVGSFIQETGRYLQDAYNKAENGYGLIQWQRGRLTKDFPYGDFDGQLAFAIRELEQSYPKANAVLRDRYASISSVRKAVKWWIGWGVTGKRHEYADQIRIEVAS